MSPNGSSPQNLLIDRRALAVRTAAIFGNEVLGLAQRVGHEARARRAPLQPGVCARIRHGFQTRQAARPVDAHWQPPFPGRFRLAEDITSQARQASTSCLLENTIATFR